mmetsp:Transcript_28764/g.67085  ORF Transcript_28764/g.67085 Transcript_28764/m.67085 type:complete len:111 (-) Transcript_28764:7-339(-)
MDMQIPLSKEELSHSLLNIDEIRARIQLAVSTTERFRLLNILSVNPYDRVALEALDNLQDGMEGQGLGIEKQSYMDEIDFEDESSGEEEEAAGGAAAEDGENDYKDVDFS